MIERRALRTALLVAIAAPACSLPPSVNRDVPTITLDGPLGSPSASTSPATSAASANPKQERAPKPLVWLTSESDARAEARREHRPMIIYLRADWAVASTRMERELWSDARVIKAAQGFVALKIDLSSTDEDAELYAARYDAPAVPATLLFDSSGRRAAMFTGEVDVDAMLAALARVGE